MHSRTTAALFMVLTVPGAIQAAGIEGTVIIKHKLTRRSVTAAAGSYQRGAAVDLVEDGPAGAEDVLGFERSHVVVYLEDGGHSAVRVTATMEQSHRRFTPDLLVIPAGSAVSFPNRDVIFHNVFSLSKPKIFDLGNYAKDSARAVIFPSPGIVFVNCRLHPNMAAAIVVTPNGWCTRADESGRFTLSDVPPGRHTVVAWHKSTGFVRKSVVVTPDRSAVLEFSLPLGEESRVISAQQR